MSDYSDIQQELDDFKNAVYGEEVRDSMISAIKKIHDMVGDAVGQLSADLDDLDAIINTGTSILNYVEDKNISATTFELVDEVGTCVSEKIPYTWTGNVAFDVGDNTKRTYRADFYDANDNHLGYYGIPSTTGGVTYRVINTSTAAWSSQAAYVRFSFKKGYAGHIYASPTVSYWIAQSVQEPSIKQDIGDLSNLDTMEKNSLVGAINEVNGRIPDVTLPIKPSDTDFFYTSPNLANPADFVVGEYVNQVTGAFATNTAQTRTGYVPVVGGNKYCIVNEVGETNVYIRYMFYKDDKAYIPNSGAYAMLSDIGHIITAPSNAAFLVMSATGTGFPFMVAQSNTKIEFVEYGITYLLPQYILDNDISEVPVNLPSSIYALVGYELNIYFENIVEDWTQYNFDVSCSKGMQLERGYQITPTTSDVGSYPLSIVISTKNGSSRKTMSTTLVVSSASAGSGQSKSIIVLGDSTTNNGAVIEKLNENFANDVMNVSTLGTRGTGPNNHEGRSGWTLNGYFTKEYIDYTDGRGHVANPFYNPSTQTFDAAYYFANSGIAIPDFFIINMGINDVFSCANDVNAQQVIDQCIDYYDAMITSLKAAAPNTKICICCTIPPNHSQDAFGKAYACGQTRNRCKRNNTLLVDRIIEEYDGRESENIYVIPIHTNLDTVYNMGMETLPVNARNTEITYQSPIQNGGVHPVASGYWQIADVYTAFLKAHA